MNWLKRVIATFFGIIGWVSGGGIATLIIVSIMKAIRIMPVNEPFVGGCIWGTCGILIAQWMIKQANQNYV